MIWARAGYLSLFGLTVLVPLIYFLRARNLRHQVSAVFLWETLQHGHRTRLARFRPQLDWVLFAQLAGLVLLIIAAAGPALRIRQPTLSAMAIVIDGSASMQGTTSTGRSKAEEARARALEILDAFPATPVTVIQLSLSPTILAPLGSDHDAARVAIAGFEPNWTGNGTIASLNTLLDSQQASDQYEQVFLISDRTVTDPPRSLPVQQVWISSAGNLSIDAFNVRIQPNGDGVVVFAGVRNDDSEYRETELRVSDGSSRVRLPLVLAPGERQTFVLPFPTANGIAYTAELTPKDGAPFDDLRYYVLPQSMPRKASWIGENDPFLRAAVEVSGPIVWTDAMAEAEFIVVNGYAALLDREHEGGALPEGNLLLVSMIEEPANEVSGEGTAAYAPMRAVAAGDPILQGISADALRVDIASLSEGESSPRLPGDGVTLLTAFEQDVLVAGVTKTGRWIALIPDLWRTNLPLSIDFPLLVANAIEHLSPRAQLAGWEQMEPGQAIDLGWAGPVGQVIDPNGDFVQGAAATDGSRRDDAEDVGPGGVLLADMPGFYEILAPSGSILMAFNVAVGESEITTTREAADTILGVRTEAALFAIWPWIALAACVILVIEAAVYHGAWSARSRR
ncbi:BatA and WFA domain-containing protein [Candidatus Bipolaricaulota bacterium]|nr:BatA and WFA domain-containing protein [Candidatus Bipolaricaulota bacterium]